MLESRIEAVFTTQVRRYLGGATFKLAPTHVGLPDRLVVLPGGRIYLVELKQKRGRLSPAQVVLHERLAALGVTVYTLYGPGDVLAWIADRLPDDVSTEAACPACSAQPGEPCLRPNGSAYTEADGEPRVHAARNLNGVK